MKRRQTDRKINLDRPSYRELCEEKTLTRLTHLSEIDARCEKNTNILSGQLQESFFCIFGYLGTDSMSVYTIICSLIGRSDSLGREGVQVYVLFLPYMYLLMNLYLAPDKLPLTPHPYSICHNNKESKKGGGKKCFLYLSFFFV